VKRILVILVGRSTEAITSQALGKFNPIDEVVFVSRNKDKMCDGSYVKAKNFCAVNGCRYIVIANGGTTEQMLSVDKELSGFDKFIEYEYYDMQKKSCKRYKFFSFDTIRKLSKCSCGNEYSVVYEGKSESILLCTGCGASVKLINKNNKGE